MRSKVLVIGFGSIGERHGRCFLKTGRCDVAVCEVSPQLRKRAEAEYGICQTYADLDAAMRDAYDCAVIATPAPLHVPMATRLASSGLHLLIEKPLSVSLDGVAELKQAIKAGRSVVMVGYTHRCNPALISMREHLLAGSFGRPLQVVGIVGQRFARYRPAYAQTYFANRSTGGGAIQDAMTHLVNAAEWLVGPITQLLADAAHLAIKHVDVEDTVHLIARHGQERDILGLYSLNLHQVHDEFTLTVVGESGACRLDLIRNRWSGKCDPDKPWEHHEFQVKDRDQIYIRQAEVFLDAAERRCPVACSLAEAEQSLRVNLAMIYNQDHTPWVDVAGRIAQVEPHIITEEPPRLMPHASCQRVYGDTQS